MDEINWHTPPTMRDPRTNKRPQMVREINKNCQQRFNFFNNRIASQWNLLPDDIVNSENLNLFKQKLDNFMDSCL